MDKRVSAATIPPMEWPIKMTRTEGSTVGDGVLAATSRSMTFSCSHSLKRDTVSCRSPRVSNLG